MGGDLISIIWTFYRNFFLANNGQTFDGVSFAFWSSISQEGSFFVNMQQILNTGFSNVGMLFISYILTLITIFILLCLLFKLFKWLFTLVFKLFRLN